MIAAGSGAQIAGYSTIIVALIAAAATIYAKRRPRRVEDAALRITQAATQLNAPLVAENARLSTKVEGLETRCENLTAEHANCTRTLAEQGSTMAKMIRALERAGIKWEDA